MNDLRQLRHFVALAEQGHFARAAEAVHLSQQALSSPQAAQAVLQHLDSYTSLRAAALYDRQGNLLAQLQRGSPLPLPEQASALASWQQQEFRASLLQALPEQARQPGYLLLVASSEVPGAFYTGTLSASLVILLCEMGVMLSISRAGNAQNAVETAGGK